MVQAIVMFSLLGSQGAPPVDQAAIDAMKKAAFLVGTWKGESTINSGGQKMTSKVTEVLSFKAGSTVLAIEGKGTNTHGKVVHDAYAVLYFDSASKGYRFKSFLSTGNKGDFTAELGNNELTWHLDAGRPVRYHVKVSGKNWVETGEVQTAPGKWTQFFQSHLTKQ